MTEQDICAFQGDYLMFELLVTADGRLVVECFDSVDSEDEDAQIELTRADARTLGTLLLRFADNGSTKP